MYVIIIANGGIMPKKFNMLIDTTFYISFQAPSNCSLNVNNMLCTIENDKVILSSSVYEQNFCRFASDVFHLHIANSVRYIGVDLFGTPTYKSVTIEEGIQTLLTDLTPSVTNNFEIPSTLTNMTYKEGQVVFPTGVHFILENDFLMDKDKTILYECHSNADIDNIPSTITVYGTFSLDSLKKDPFYLPDQIIRVEYRALPSQCETLVIGENSKVEEIRYVDFTQCDFFPKSLRSVNTVDINNLQYQTTIEPGCKAFELTKNVWYHRNNNELTAVALYDPNVSSIDFVYDTILSSFFDGINTEALKEITYSASSKIGNQIGTNFKNFEQTSCDAQRFRSKSSTNLYNTRTIGNLTLPIYTVLVSGIPTKEAARVTSTSLPMGILDLFATAAPYSFSIQDHNPWIHVPKNSQLTPSSFGGCSLIYDMEEESVGTKGLSGGANIVLIAIICFIVFWFCCRKKGDEKSDSKDEKDEV